MFKITVNNKLFTECETLGQAFTTIDNWCQDNKFNYDLETLDVIKKREYNESMFDTEKFNCIVLHVIRGKLRTFFKIFAESE